MEKLTLRHSKLFRGLLWSNDSRTEQLFLVSLSLLDKSVARQATGFFHLFFWGTSQVTVNSFESKMQFEVKVIFVLTVSV